MSIRDIALFLLVFGAIPFMIRRPAVGIMAVGMPGLRWSWARHRLLTGVTSIRYARPPIVSSKR